MVSEAKSICSSFLYLWCPLLNHYSDQPLLHFYHDVFLETTNPQPFDSTESIAKVGEDNNIDVGGLVRIAFRKCAA